MTSNLGCIGFDTPDPAALGPILDRVVTDGTVVGRAGGVTTHQLTDASGSRLTVGIRDMTVVDLLPSYAATPGARLADVRVVNKEGTVIADVLDEAGELCTRLTCDLEQWRHLGGDPVSGDASLTALGVEVSVHADAAAFAVSTASLLDPEAGPSPDARRFAAESFISYGAFAAPSDAHGGARLAGVVVACSTHTVAATGQSFHAARVRTTGFEVDLCLPATDHPEAPAVGAVVSGNVFLVASMPELWSVTEEPRKRRWFARS